MCCCCYYDRSFIFSRNFQEQLIIIRVAAFKEKDYPPIQPRERETCYQISSPTEDYQSLTNKAAQAHLSRYSTQYFLQTSFTSCLCVNVIW